MKTIKKLLDKIKRRIVARQIESGRRPRGRTNLSPMAARGIGPEKPEGVLKMTAALSARVMRAGRDSWDELGVISTKKVTTAFVNYLVDSFQNSAGSPLDVFKYHDSGIGAVGESNGDTALGNPCGEARDTGSQAEGASANIYKTIATHTYAGTFAITEHGVFSASSSGTLLDRSVFSAINVITGDKIEFTYQLTCAAET